MALVKVDPDILSRISKNIGVNAARVIASGNFIKLAGLRARTYDKKSFGPEVRRICQDGLEKGSKTGANLATSSGILSRISSDFADVDNRFLRGFMGGLVRIIRVNDNSITSRDTDEETIFGPKKPEILVNTSPFVGGFIVTGSYLTYENGTRLHQGLDLKPKGSDKSVHPIGSGEIHEIGYDKSGYGHHVVIKHQTEGGNTIYSLYAHLASKPTNLEVGKKITTDDVIGEMGNSGGNYGEHLHLEICKDMNHTWYKGQVYYNFSDPSVQNYSDAKSQIENHYYNPERVISGEIDLKIIN